MGWLMGRKSKFETFWEWFVERETVYFELREATREKEMNELYKRLQKVNKHLAFEFSHELVKGRREMIISADGMVEAFEDVLDLVNAAPESARFEIIPFRQPSTEEFTVAFGGIELSRDDVYFDAEHNEVLDLTVYAKGYTEEKEEEYISALFLILDGVVGEFFVGMRIGDIVFKAYENQSEARPIVELMDLLADAGEEEEEYPELDLSFLPPTLQKLKAFDESLQEQGRSLDDGVGVRWTDRSMAYQETPLDVLPFMDVGVDGIHVGLLTDFGQVKDLEEAFVVLVMPADPESGRILARNPKEFIDYLCSDPYLPMFYNGLMIDSAEKHRQVIADADQDFAENPELENPWKAAAAELLEAMDAEQIADVYGYVAEVVTAARESQVALPTLGGIGVVSTEDVGELPVFRLEEDERVNLEEVKQFFATAPVTSKQAFIRDAQYTRALFEEPELKAFILDELEAMGCSAEAERLRSMDW